MLLTTDDDLIEECILRKSPYPTLIYKGEKCSVKETHYARLWSTILSEVDVRKNLKQIQPPAVTLVIRFTKKLSKPVYEDVIFKIQTDFATGIVVDECSDNAFHAIVIETKTGTEIFFPMCRLYGPDIESIHHRHICSLLKSLNDYIIPYSHSDPYTGYVDGIFKGCYKDPVFDEDAALDGVRECKLSPSLIDWSLFSLFDDGTMMEEDMIIYDDDAKYWLPILLSVNFCRTVSKIKDLSDEIEKEYFSQEKVYDVNKILAAGTVTDTVFGRQEYKMFLAMLNPYTITHTDWETIGKALYTLEMGEDSGLHLWYTAYVQSCTNFDICPIEPFTRLRAFLRNKYVSYANNGKDIKSLAELAKRDNPREYATWHVQWVDEAFIASMTGLEGDLARPFYRLYWLKYCCNVKTKSVDWYVFENHKLRSDSSTHLINTISNDFLIMYNRIRHDISGNYTGTTNGQTNGDIALANITKSIDSLKRESFKNRLCKELSHKFHVQGLNKLLDQNRYLTPIQNGVMEVRGKDIIFRKGYLQDYLMRPFGVSFRAEYTYDHPLVRRGLKWMKMTWFHQETIDWVGMDMSSILIGGNLEKLGVFWIGIGGWNMKSSWENALQEIAGMRSMTIRSEHFTRQAGDANGTTPSEIRLAYGVRVMFADELGDNMTFIPGVFKKETGNDRRNGRENYGESTDYKTQHIFIGVGNKAPRFDSQSPIKKRLVLVPFNSTVSDQAPATEEEQWAQRHFPVDEGFDNRIHEILDAVFWILVMYFPRYMREGLYKRPPEILNALDEYWESNDVYTCFIKGMMKKVPGESVEVDNVVATFERYHSRRHAKSDIPERYLIKERLIAKLGAPTEDDIWENWEIQAN